MILTDIICYNNFIYKCNYTIIWSSYGDGGGLTNVEGQKRSTSFTNGNTRTFQLYTNTPLEIKSLGFGRIV
jgi:hypothetical protein